MGRPIPVNRSSSPPVPLRVQTMPSASSGPQGDVERLAGLLAAMPSTGHAGGALGRFYARMGVNLSLLFVMVGGCVGFILSCWGMMQVRRGMAWGGAGHGEYILVAGLVLTAWSIFVLIGTHAMSEIERVPVGMQIQALLPVTVGALAVLAFLVLVAMVLAVTAVMLVSSSHSAGSHDEQ